MALGLETSLCDPFHYVGPSLLWSRGQFHLPGTTDEERKRIKDMKENVYKRFASLLESGTYGSFEAVCRRLGICPDDMDELLLAELGYNGEQVFDDYFGNRCKNY